MKGSDTATGSLFWAGTLLWLALWAVFVARLVWLDARLLGHLAEHHPHRWRKLSLGERITWSCWIVFRSTEDYGDPIVGARRREILSVFFDMLLLLAALIVWFVVSAAVVGLAR